MGNQVAWHSHGPQLNFFSMAPLRIVFVAEAAGAASHEPQLPEGLAGPGCSGARRLRIQCAAYPECQDVIVKTILAGEYPSPESCPVSGDGYARQDVSFSNGALHFKVIVGSSACTRADDSGVDLPTAARVAECVVLRPLLPHPPR